MTRLLCLFMGHRCRSESYFAYTWDALEICCVRRWCERCGRGLP